MARVAGKVAIITGAAGGIGQAAARRLHAEGARVLLVDVDGDAVDAAAAALGEGARGHVADVADPVASEGYAEAALVAWGRLDVVVANAGVAGPMTPLCGTTVEDFDRVMAINVRGVWLAMRAAIPRMGAGGSVIVTSSIAGLRGVRLGGAYVASKHAVTGLVKTAALEHARAGIRVNTIHPGVIDTEMARELEGVIAPDHEEARARLLRTIPLRRYGAPEDVADLILFLASDESRHCTGASFVIDGGQTAS